MAWEVEAAAIDSHELKKLLDDDWEPFAVTHQEWENQRKGGIEERDYVWMKRKKEEAKTPPAGGYFERRG